jgi:ribose transport system ATP-binding protein
VLRNLRAEGAGVIYVSHRLSEVLTIADRITVMRDGSREATVSSADVTESQLGRLIMGHDLIPHNQTRATKDSAARVLLDVRRMSSDRLRPLDLQLRAGEVVGCSGLKGAGHEDIGRIIFGLEIGAGSIRVNGKPLATGNTQTALEAGISYVAGDRKQGLVSTMTITENLFLNPSLNSGIFRKPRSERTQASEVVAKYGVRPGEPERQIDELSGGNAQKIAFARALEAHPQVLILDEPTAGIDVGARNELYGLVDQAVAAGMCVLVISTDYDEVVRLCDRVLIFQRGAVTSVLGRAQITRNALTATAMGAA